MAAKPLAPARDYSFTDWSITSPTAPHPGQNIDQELDRTNDALADALAWVATALGDDGAIRAQSVAYGMLTPDAVSQLKNETGANAVATSAANAATSETNAANSAASASASAATATQKAADAQYYASLAQTIAGGAMPATSVTFTPGGSIAATDAQAAIMELDGDLTAHKTGAGVHAISAVTGLQAALDAKLDDSQAGTTGLSVLGAATAAAARSAIGAPASNAGELAFFFRSTPPPGFLAANGAAVDRSTYADLDAAIYCGDVNNATASWGYRCTDPLNPSTTRSATGTHVVLPDMRGEFVRGWDNGRGVDSGRTLWSYQSGALASHTHTATSTGTATTTIDAGGDHSHQYSDRQQSDPGFGVPTGANDTAIRPTATDVTRLTVGAGAHSHPATTTVTITTTVAATGGTETRPRNAAPLACIRY